MSTLLSLMMVKVVHLIYYKGESPYDIIFALNMHTLCSRIDRKLKSTCLAFNKRVCHVKGEINDVINAIILKRKSVKSNETIT